MKRIDHRKTLLKRRTPSEIRLSCALLATSDWYFNEQVYFRAFGKNYYVDFYFPDVKVIVELDGGVHSDRIEYDQDRDRRLRLAGKSTRLWLRNEIVRFENEYVDTEIGAVLRTIKNAIKRQIHKVEKCGTEKDRKRVSSAILGKNMLRHIRRGVHKAKQDAWQCKICGRDLELFIKYENKFGRQSN